MTNQRLSALRDNLRASFWLIPALMSVAAAVLAFVAVEIDLLFGDAWLVRQGWFFIDSADGARAALSTIAGSTISVAGTVFSLTMVVLTLASNQFGPRLVRNFARDRSMQVCLGTFVSTYLYCLLVLRGIRGSSDFSFVPNLAVLIANLLALLNVGVLIYFVHHVAAAIQISNVIAYISTHLRDTIVRLYPPAIPPTPAEDERARAAAALRTRMAEAALTLTARGSGYLQAIDDAALFHLAVRNNLVLALEVRPGDFVLDGSTIALMHSPSVPNEAQRRAIDAAVNDALVLGTLRSALQDLEVYIFQLVEIASRALSPAFNDPFTATQCVDRLGEALCLLDERALPAPFRYDDAGQLRLVSDPFTFAGAVDAAFDMIRQYGREHPAVTARLLETLALLAAQTERPDRRPCLRRHADMIISGARAALPEPHDVQELERRYQAVLRALTRTDELVSVPAGYE